MLIAVIVNDSILNHSMSIGINNITSDSCTIEGFENLIQVKEYRQLLRLLAQERLALV